MTLLASGKVLVVGGWDQLGIGIVATAEMYDAATNSWSAVGSLVTGRYDHTATLLSSGRLLISAGFGSTYLASAELYDPASNGWSATGSVAIARYLHTATRLSTGDVLVTGGLGVSSGAAPIADAELYDLPSATWK